MLLTLDKTNRTIQKHK